MRGFSGSDAKFAILPLVFLKPTIARSRCASLFDYALLRESELEKGATLAERLPAQCKIDIALPVTVKNLSSVTSINLITRTRRTRSNGSGGEIRPLMTAPFGVSNMIESSYRNSPTLSHESPANDRCLSTVAHSPTLVTGENRPRFSVDCTRRRLRKTEVARMFTAARIKRIYTKMYSGYEKWT